MRRLVYVALGFLLILLSSCAVSQKKEQLSSEDTKVFGSEVSVTLELRDTAIEGPDNDRRSYYKIYIDKIEAGRTEIALESQRKTFRTTLDPNRHLLRIEKYVLDSKNNRYAKLNNIEQPKPDYFYFDTTQANTVKVLVEHDVQSHQTDYVYTKR